MKISKKQYEKNGFIIIEDPSFKNIRELIKDKIIFYANYILLKKKFINKEIDSFNDLSNILVKIDKRSDIISNLYDLLPADTFVFNLSNKNIFKKIARGLSIKNPLVGTIPTIRFDRPMDTNRNTPMHRDYWYSFLSNNSLTIWFNLETKNRNLGNLIVYPESHKITNDVIKDTKKGTFELNNKNIKLQNKKEINLENNQILVFNQKLIHQSGINKSTKCRISMQIRYNDLNNLNEFKSSFRCTTSNYVIKKQVELLNEN